MSHELRLLVIDDKPHWWTPLLDALAGAEGLEAPTSVSIDDADSLLTKSKPALAPELLADIYLVDIWNKKPSEVLQGDRVADEIRMYCPGSRFILVSNFINSRGACADTAGQMVQKVVESAMRKGYRTMSKKAPMRAGDYQINMNAAGSELPIAFIPGQVERVISEASGLCSFAPDEVHVLPCPIKSLFPVAGELKANYATRVSAPKFPQPVPSAAATKAHPFLIRIDKVIQFISAVHGWNKVEEEPEGRKTQSSLVFARRGKGKVIPQQATEALGIFLCKKHHLKPLALEHGPLVGWNSVVLGCEAFKLGTDERFNWLRRGTSNQLKSIRREANKYFVDLDVLLSGRLHGDRLSKCFDWKTPKEQYELTFAPDFPKLRIHVPPANDVWNEWPLLKAVGSLFQKGRGK